MSGKKALVIAIIPGFGFEVVGSDTDELVFGSARNFDIDGILAFESDVLFAIFPVDGLLRMNLFCHNKSSLKRTVAWGAT